MRACPQLVFPLLAAGPRAAALAVRQVRVSPTPQAARRAAVRRTRVFFVAPAVGAEAPAVLQAAAVKQAAVKPVVEVSQSAAFLPQAAGRAAAGRLAAAGKEAADKLAAAGR